MPPDAAITARPARARPARSRPLSGDGRLSWRTWLDVGPVLLWTIGLAAIALRHHWESIPLIVAMFWVVLWHSHRRFEADAERARVSEENALLLATQRRFLQDASHQLRTPITIALGHSELLARSLADNQDKRDINVIVGELNRLRVLSDRLLLIASSENPDYLRPELVALDQFTMEVIRSWRPAADRHWQLGQLDRVAVQADRERLRLAVDALLENATQHTVAGDTIRLSVVADAGGEFVRLAVADSGSGVAPADLASIFERFATGQAPAGRRGTGLGLALVRAVARGHGGDIQVRSSPGAGATFELLLPTLHGRSSQLALTAPPRAAGREMHGAARIGAAMIAARMARAEGTRRQRWTVTR